MGEGTALSIRTEGCEPYSIDRALLWAIGTLESVEVCCAVSLGVKVSEASQMAQRRRRPYPGQPTLNFQLLSSSYLTAKWSAIMFIADLEEL